jgi:hypothetical protein
LHWYLSVHTFRYWIVISFACDQIMGSVNISTCDWGMERQSYWYVLSAWSLKLVKSNCLLQPMQKYDNRTGWGVTRIITIISSWLLILLDAERMQLLPRTEWRKNWIRNIILNINQGSNHRRSHVVCRVCLCTP